MAKKFNYTYILLGIGALVLLSTFKKKALAGLGLIYRDQTDPPAGTKQVYSKVGTKLYNRNGDLIYTYNEANLGMSIVGVEKNGTLSVVFGDTFDQGLPAFVKSNEVQYL
jgi:hypothetical protein